MTRQPRRPCLVCGEPGPGSYCPRHDPRGPGATRRRGYGADHQRRRRLLLPAALGTPCPLCGEPMLPGQPLDLDHSIPLTVDPSSVGDRIVHAHCNRGRRGRMTERKETR